MAQEKKDALVNQEQFMLKVGQKDDNGFICVAHVNLLVRPSKTNSKKADIQPEFVISKGASLNDVGEFYIQFGKSLKKAYSQEKKGGSNNGIERNGSLNE